MDEKNNETLSATLSPLEMERELKKIRQEIKEDGNDNIYKKYYEQVIKNNNDIYKNYYLELHKNDNNCYEKNYLLIEENKKLLNKLYEKSIDISEKIATIVSLKQELNEKNDIIERLKNLSTYSGIISIYVYCCNNLPKADTYSDSDPYVVFNNFNNEKSENVKSNVINDNNDPIWNEKLTFSVTNCKKLNIKIYDKDFGKKDDLLCTNILELCTLYDGSKHSFNNYSMNVTKEFEKQNKKPMFKFDIQLLSFSNLPPTK